MHVVQYLNYSAVAIGTSEMIHIHSKWTGSESKSYQLNVGPSEYTRFGTSLSTWKGNNFLRIKNNET